MRVFARVLQHIDELVDDEHAVVVLNRESDEGALGVLTCSLVVDAEKHYEPADAAAPSDGDAVALVVGEREKCARRLLLRLRAACALKQRDERQYGASLGDGDLRRLMTLGEARESTRRILLRLLCLIIESEHERPDAARAHDLVASVGIGG